MLRIFTGVSEACCKWLEHFNIKAKGVWHNAIDIEEEKQYSEYFLAKEKKKTIQIFYAGRLIKDKGVLLLVQAYEELKKKYDTITLSFAGEGPLYEELQNNPNVIALGKLERKDIMRQYAKADIFVSPSSFPEGLPTTILEAGLMNCAVVATAMGGTTEIIQDGITGLICKPEVSDITKKIEKLIQEEDFREELAKNLHNKICKDFSWENTTKQILEKIEE